MARRINFSAVILAGGQSRRMRRDKATVRWKGKTFLERAVAAVKRAGAKEILISGQKNGDYSAIDCPVIFDRKPYCGPLGGIERALQISEAPLLLVLAVDMPQMTSLLLRKLVAACCESVGVVPSIANGLEPLAAVYPKACHAILVKMLEQRSYSAREFAEACERSGLIRKLDVAPREEGQFANFNYLKDLRSAKRARKSGK